MKTILISLLVLLGASNNLLGQPNCKAFLFMGDTLKFEACEKSEEIKGHYQFSRAFQMILDDALTIDPSFDFAYVEKSVAYLKSGDFLTWKRLMDKAVEFNQEGNLGYRGWCRYQFFRDYKGAIEDIERLENLIQYDIGTSANGDYHLQIVRAICYNAIGDRSKAIEIIESQLARENHIVGKYDYLHLGVMYLTIGNFEKARQAFSNQENHNDLAENHYYMALLNRELNNRTEHIAHLEKAKEMYNLGRIMFDPYTHPYHKVYFSDIEKELEKAMMK